jgi:hypothetical protein
MIFIAGCSTLAPPVVDQPSSTSVGPAPGTQAPTTTDAGKHNAGEFENGGTAAADKESEKNAATEKNPKPAEPDKNSAAGQDFANNRVDKDEEYLIPSPLLPYDGIAPVYEPRFVTAEESPLVADELVMGVSINGESKAYPVSVLRFREMVDDELGGLPILVTW